MSDITEADLRMEPSAVYREDVFTDQHVGTIRRMTPVTPDGAPDPSRPVLFVGQTQVMTSAGMLPITFDIPVATLAEAIEGFGRHAKRGIEETMEELQQLRRQAASSLVIPDAGTTSTILGGGAGPRPPGGGKIRLT